MRKHNKTCEHQIDDDRSCYPYFEPVVETKPEKWNRTIAPILDKVANRLERKLRILYPSNEGVEKDLRRTEFISTMNDIRNEAFDAFGYGDVELTKHKIDKKTSVLGI